MSKRSRIVATAFMFGGLAMFVMSELANRSSAVAANAPGPPNILGLLDQTFKEVQQLQQQVKDLQAQISSLATKQELQVQQVALQKLQTQFANHHHVVEESVPPQPFRGAMYTTLNCPGIGQPCSLNSTSGSGGSTYGLYLFPPGSSPPNTPGPAVANVTTSGPQE
jgi:TolA-binding protein